MSGVVVMLSGRVQPIGGGVGIAGDRGVAV